MTDDGLAHLHPRERKRVEAARKEEREKRDIAEFNARRSAVAPPPDPAAVEAARQARDFAISVECAKGNLREFASRCPGGMRFALNEPHGPVRLQFHSDDPAGRFRIMEIMTLEEAVRRKIM